MKEIQFPQFTLGKKHPLVLISGPCVIESEELALSTAEALKKMCDALGISLIYKSSFDKANRSSYRGARGPGLEKGLAILQKVKDIFNVPILTDIHLPEQAEPVAAVCDVLQIPAFLCRQTDLICAAARTGAVINIKKGQFMAPWDMGNAVDKVRAEGNEKVMLTDRGTSFGYNNLVCDMRGIPLMQKLGVPVCFDATHAVQLPGGHGSSSGGQREFIFPLAKAALATGCDCLFMESHPDPAHALSDKDSVVPLSEMPRMLTTFKQIYDLIQAN